MLKLEVFDPPMCCSSGVCGPQPDPRLAVFSADLDWLRRQGVTVQRYNLSQEPAAFATHAEVARLLRQTDGDCLPIVVANGQVVSQAVYPSRQDLLEFAGLSDRAEKHSEQSQGCAPAGGCC
jgi:arsenite methyltransferase